MPAPSVVGTPVANRYGNLTATVPSGADFLIGGAGYAPGGVDPAPGATWDGTALTLIGQEPAGSSFSTIAALGLVNPAAGTLTYAISGTGAANRAVLALDDVDTATPTDAISGASGTGTAPAVTCSTDDNALAVAILRFTGFGNTVTPGAGETIRVQLSEDGGGIAILTKAGAASVSFAPTLSASAGWNIIAFGVNGTGGGGGGPSAAARAQYARDFLRIRG